jgi:hypothetical protein
MITLKKPDSQNYPSETSGQDENTKSKAPLSDSTLDARLVELEGLPHRHAAVHWVAFTLSLLSFILILTWLLGSKGPVPRVWMWLDVGLGVIFAIEFFTRSGFRWHPLNYTVTRFFDFVAIVPALVLVNHGFFGEEVWVWIILVARFARIIDRFLGDGFVTRNVLALIEGFEEEITDRVMERIIGRVQVAVDQARLSHKVAESLENNKDHVLERIRAATPREGLLPGIARIVGLDTALERAEERAYAAVVKIMDSEEMDRTIRDTINSSFTSLLEEVGKRHWRQHLGIRSSGNKSNIHEVNSDRTGRV